MIEQRLLDQLEDARAAHRSWIRTRNWLVAGIALGLALLIGGPIVLSVLYALHVNLGYGSAGIPLVGALVAVGSGLALAFTAAEIYDGSAQRLRRAERDYRDAVMREGR